MKGLHNSGYKFLPQINVRKKYTVVDKVAKLVGVGGQEGNSTTLQWVKNQHTTVQKCFILLSLK